MLEIQPYLEAGVPPFYDLIIMTNGPEVTKLINSGWLTPLDPLRMSRFTRNASDLVRDPPWDPGNRYTVAWQSRLTGIAFRPEAEEVLGREPRSINDLFDTALEGPGRHDVRLARPRQRRAPGGRHRSRDSTEADWLLAADRLREQRGPASSAGTTASPISEP